MLGLGQEGKFIRRSSDSEFDVGPFPPSGLRGITDGQTAKASSAKPTALKKATLGCGAVVVVDVDTLVTPYS